MQGKGTRCVYDIEPPLNGSLLHFIPFFVCDSDTQAWKAVLKGREGILSNTGPSSRSMCLSCLLPPLLLQAAVS